MLRAALLAAIAAAAGFVSISPALAWSGPDGTYSAYYDAPHWLPPAPYPFPDAPPAVFAPNFYLERSVPWGHVAWCEAKYRSYNPSTDMFLGYDGEYHRCRGPYV